MSLANRTRGDVLVLCYHALSERWPAALSTTPREFEAQVSLLARRGYRGVTFEDAVHGPAAERAVAITFDDAFRSVFELARPILEHHRMPATVFVPTSFAGTETPMSWTGIGQWTQSEYETELMPMSWEQLGRLAGHGWEIGSHTRSHPRLTVVDQGRLAEELAGSREDCERELGLPCRSLAYPYGDHDQRVVEAAKTAGYRAAGTLPGRFPRVADAYAYPRVGVYRNDPRWRFRLKVSPVLRRLRASTVWSVLDRGRGISGS
jgi:peptidoglycan/xylan/chitin deacetylase (PgdA/CDA1 family)